MNEYHPRGAHLSFRDREKVLKAEREFPFDVEGTRFREELDAWGNPTGTEYDANGKPIRRRN